MAIYVPPSRRRRRLVLTGLACLVAGLAGGLLLGRASVTTTGQRIGRVRREAGELATRIEALTIEYEQAVSGVGDTIEGGVLAPLAEIEDRTDRALDDAEWLDAGARARLRDAIAAVEQAANRSVDPVQFAERTEAAAAALRRELGVGP